MKINENTLLEGKKVVLVPYSVLHVPRYHQWMRSEELQKLTASEPLNLDQEYDMQRSWREDEDKCTFIVLDKQRWADASIPEDECMVGDVNLFLTDPVDLSLAELELMIAEPGYRGRGLGKEVTRMMMCYGINKLGIKKFEVKIGLDNQTSIAMFKKLQFYELSLSEVFREITLGINVNQTLIRDLLDNTALTQELEYTTEQERRHGAKLLVSTEAGGS